MNKINNINRSFFQKNRFIKLLAGTFLIASLLTGCGTPSIEANNPVNETATVVEYEYYPVEVIYKNYDIETIKEELVFFKDENNLVYSAFSIDPDGVVETSLRGKNGKVYSSLLVDSITLPEASDDSKVVITIDYNTKTIEAHNEYINNKQK